LPVRRGNPGFRRKYGYRFSISSARIPRIERRSRRRLDATLATLDRRPADAAGELGIAVATP
jgi:hypothetical protein